ncbi:MAG: indole-3-glycerol-phosphate synthase [Phycisphaerae bacterium]
MAEIKRRSPSAGDLRPIGSVAALAREYDAAGAVALSCLTDAAHFGARPGDLPEARAACRLPVLRKDFIVDRRQLVESRQMGADAILLIVRILAPAALRDLLAAAAELGLAALVEAHDAAEVEQAVAAGAAIVGVNSRDLATGAVALERVLPLRSLIPADRLAVAESGVRSAADVRALASAGFDAALVGTALLRSSRPGAMLAELRGEQP